MVATEYIIMGEFHVPVFAFSVHSQMFRDYCYATHTSTNVARRSAAGGCAVITARRASLDFWV